MTDAAPSTAPASAPDPITALLGVLDVAPGAGPDAFTATNLPKPGGRVFGGQVIAQDRKSVV